jgi:hypothetical protein
MAIVPFSAASSDTARKAVLTAADDTSDFLGLNGPCNIMVSGGSAFSVEVYRTFEADNSVAILVGSQDETERAAYYDFVGRGRLQVKLVSVTSGPVTVYLAA